MKKFILLSLIIILIFSQNIYAMGYPPFQASYLVSPQATVEFEGKSYEQLFFTGYNVLKGLLADRYHWYHTDVVFLVSPIKFMNGKIYYDFLPDGDPNLPWLLTRDEYIKEEGIYNYFKTNYPISGDGDPFIDLESYSDSPDIWYVPYTKKLIVAGLITGYPYGSLSYSFQSDRNISKAELVTILSKLQLKSIRQYHDEFDDVKKTDWYYDYIKTAYEKGIIEIENNKFNPNDEASREFTSEAISKVIKPSKINNQLNFIDKNDISDKYLDGVAVLYNNGIISGYKDNSFRPKNTITRAELASMLSQCLDQKLLAGKTPSEVYADNYLEEYKKNNSDDKNKKSEYDWIDFK